VQNTKCKKGDALAFFNVHGRQTTILQKKEDMFSINRTYSSLTNNVAHKQPGQIRSKTVAKSTSNEQGRKLMRSTWLGLAFIKFRYLAYFQETGN